MPTSADEDKWLTLGEGRRGLSHADVGTCGFPTTCTAVHSKDNTTKSRDHVMMIAVRGDKLDIRSHRLGASSHM
jgi:hypothetical protein